MSKYSPDRTFTNDDLTNGIEYNGYEFNTEQIKTIPTKFRKNMLKKFCSNFDFIHSKYIKYYKICEDDEEYNEEIKAICVSWNVVKLDNLSHYVTHLKLCHLYEFNLDYLPHTIKHLSLRFCEINKNINNLPNSIKYLELDECVIDNVDDLNNLPDSIEVLAFNSCVNELKKFPSKLNKIIFFHHRRADDINKLRITNKVLKLFYDDYDTNYDVDDDKLRIKIVDTKTNQLKYIELIEEEHM